VNSTADKQAIAKVQVWPGANAEFDLYQDDGKTYAYEKGDFQLTHLEWDESAHALRHTGFAAWNGADDQVVEVVEAKR
jgi:alpha-D-xyloside xylohydrolase